MTYRTSLDMAALGVVVFIGLALVRYVNFTHTFDGGCQVMTAMGVLYLVLFFAVLTSRSAYRHVPVDNSDLDALLVEARKSTRGDSHDSQGR